MGRKKLGKKRIHVYLPAGLVERLDAAGAALAWDRNRVIEEACEVYLKKLKRKKRAGG